MSKICPFMSGGEADSARTPRDINYIPCLTERCMLWVDGCVFTIIRKFSTKERPKVEGPPCPFCGGESTLPLIPIEGDIFRCLACKKHFHAPSPGRISKEPGFQECGVSMEMTMIDPPTLERIKEGVGLTKKENK